MTDVELQVEVQLMSNSPAEQHGLGGLQEDFSGEEPDCMESSQNTGEEAEEPLSSLVDVALTPPCGDRAACGCECEACSCVEVRCMERSLQSMQLQLQFLMRKADDLQDCLVSGQGHLESEGLAAEVPSFLYTCQPYFNHLESTTRSTMCQHISLPSDIYTRRVQLLDFSQQLCNRLEQLVLTYASYSLLCLDEAEPNSVSHFCIGQSQLGCLRMTTFLYCKLTPYLARVDTGLYKRMRWNVERLRDERQQTDEELGGENEKREVVGDTEYYFLCYEDIPNTHTDANRDSKGVSHADVLRMWSIGQWVQVNPDPDTEDIYDWIMCEVPQANYHRLLFLGSDEPSICSATDVLQELLLSHQTTV
ncbi:UPF0575 protein C19orf67 homolog isoform X1 [Micropterus dolomieu]|uniref:UPF0575 protein C19orf67 homolog isoform X1 n=2 Tax=Micropterus dolomieu TaxID=147949 RepID=UPI001E8D5F5C|nr:UPF0575 protein C19orf67 homolog isoform X1 [Micropterus dolomieu]XP_045902496.1 UPF0575 protein C19orf67 homolog isoform X1 [Micropterus dolomieu]